jgi:hypothetical protein
MSNSRLLARPPISEKLALKLTASSNIEQAIKNWLGDTPLNLV